VLKLLKNLARLGSKNKVEWLFKSELEFHRLKFEYQINNSYLRHKDLGFRFYCMF